MHIVALSDPKVIHTKVHYVGMTEIQTLKPYWAVCALRIKLWQIANLISPGVIAGSGPAALMRCVLLHADQEGVRAPCVSRLAADGDRGRQMDGEELQKLRRLCSARAPGTSVSQHG